MMEQVRLCAVSPMEKWLGSPLNKIQGWTTVRESYSHALELRPLPPPPPLLQVQVPVKNIPSLPPSIPPFLLSSLIEWSLSLSLLCDQVKKIRG